MGTSAMLAGGQLALSGVSNFAKAGMAKKDANSTIEAAAAANQATQVELTRQQRETHRVAAESRSDVVRRADDEIGALRAAVGELGASRASQAMLLSEIAAVEGNNLGRIEANREADIQSLQSSKVASAQGYANTVVRATNQARAARTDAILNFVGTGLQIGANYHARQVDLENARNRRT